MLSRSYRLPARPSALLRTSRFASTAAISNPKLRGIETRWETMTEGEREDIVSELTERQKVAWKELTPLEKRAAWYISYGEWGPRRPVHPKGAYGSILKGIAVGLGAALALFGTFRFFAPPLSKTMSKEWQEKSNEMLAEINAEPFTGHNQVQSPNTGISAEDLEEDDE